MTHSCWEPDCILFLDHGGMHVTATGRLHWGSNGVCSHCGARACACEHVQAPPYKVGSYEADKRVDLTKLFEENRKIVDAWPEWKKSIRVSVER